MIYSIHLLRFVAAFGVLLHHVYAQGENAINVGAAGVDVFFVISGFVLGLTAAKGDSPTAFLASRFVRVVPLYWAATAAQAGFRVWAWNDMPSLHDWLISLSLLPSLDGGTVLIYFPGWTLAWELLFYATLAASLRAPSPAAAAAVVMIGLSGLSFPSFWGTHSIVASDFCLEFAAGLIIAEAWRRNIRPSKVFGVLSLAVAGACLAINCHVAAVRPIGWGMPAALVVIGCLAFEDRPWLRSRLAKLAGSSSYALYLSHITVSEFVRELLAHHGYLPQEHEAVVRFACVISALGSSCVVHALVERPFLRAMRLMMRRLKLDQSHRRSTSDSLAIEAAPS